MSLLRILLMLVALLGVLLIVQSSILFWRINKGIRIAQNSLPFEKKAPKAPIWVLIVGDSTGVGTGAKQPFDSVGGRLSQDFPDAAIINRSVNGACIADVVVQLKLHKKEQVDLVIVQVGGNDILRFTNLDLLRQTTADLLETASRKAEKVIFLSTGNVGLAPAFFPPLNWIYTRQTRKVRSIFMDAAEQQGIEYVDLFEEKDTDPFLKNPGVCYAADFLHPGSEGYRLWYEEIKKRTSLLAFMEEKLTR